MKLLIGFALMIGMLVFTGCVQKDVEIAIQPEVVRVIDINPPKYFSIKIRFNDGTDMNLSGGKHCGHWKNIQVGDEYRVNVHYYKRDGKVYKSVYHNACEIARTPALYTP